MLLNFFFVLVFFDVVVSQVTYDAFFGKPITNNRQQQLSLLNATGPCTIEVQPCRKDEYRRVDGTCVNPKYPSRNGSPTPLLRMLPAKYGLGNSLRPALNGSELPSTRLLRTKILNDGYDEDRTWSTLATHFFVFATVDVVDLTVLQFFQYALPTPLEDLSVVYGYTNARAREIRELQGGLLKTQFQGGVERPPGTAPWCVENRRPVENSCYEFGDSYDGSVLVGITLTAFWFYREHNRLAKNLAIINPCWDDEQLYQVARQINIAQWQYMLFYELFADILGRKNALAAGVIYDTKGYVNDFDEKYKPGVYHEYVIGTRFFHTFQDGRTDLYSRRGKYLGTRTTVDDEFRSGIFEVNNTEADLTQGAFQQPSAKFDHTMDPDLAERLFGEIQAASDLPAIDMQRGRDEGLPPYNEYRKICGLPYAKDFDDLKDTILPDRLKQLKRIYDDVDDVELMVAIYSEKFLPGSNQVTPTLFCIMVQNLVQWRRSDKYWFEHGDHPTALTLPQLNEIRKTSVARLLCDNGDQVDRIQPRALLNLGKENEIKECKEIPGINLNKWEDHQCYKETDEGFRDEGKSQKDGKGKDKGGEFYWGKK